MKFINVIFLGLFIPATCVVSAGGPTPINGLTKLKDVDHQGWQQVTNTIFSATNRLPVKIGARKCLYQDNAGTASFGMAVTAFISPGLQKIWVGPESDFYFESDSGVVGIRPERGGVVWCDNLVPKAYAGGTNLATAISQFGSDVSIADWFDAWCGGFPDVETRYARHATDLRFVFSKSAFTNGQGSSQPSPDTGVIAVEMDGGDLKLTLENPASKFAGVAWINPQTRKVTKATEGGKSIELRDEMLTPHITVKARK